MRMSRPGVFRFLLAAAILLSAAGAQAQEERLPVNMDPCGAVVFAALPGDFNFCAGRKQWAKGRYEQARELFVLSAGWGNKLAQRLLGLAYFNGEGGVKDRPLGLAWLALAAERQDPTAASLYLSALARATPAEKSRAQALYAQMRARYADDVAAARAERRFRRAIKELTSDPVYGRGRCIVGANSDAIDPSVDPLSGNDCSAQSERAVIRSLEIRSTFYFNGWNGRVSVGPAEAVPGGG